MQSKTRELLDELRTVLGNRLLDAILPPVLFLITNGLFGLTTAMVVSLGLVLVLAVSRLRRQEPVSYALAGVASVLLAIGLAWVLGRAEGYFLPALVNGAITIALCIISLLVGRPLTAWSSYMARRWPLDWYWHPRVRPAYMETTVLWFLFFSVRLWWQATLFRNAEADVLAWVNTLMGWPALILLLIVTYLYGVWRLRRLGGPSVDEFEKQIPPPWQGQQKGF